MTVATAATEPVALGVEHLDPHLARLPFGLTLETAAKPLDAHSLFVETDMSFLIGQLFPPAHHVDIEVDSLIGGAAVVSLEEDAWAISIGVNHC